VSFSGSSFIDASLAGARLYAVDFRGARLKGVKLDGVCFDAKTVWPDGFNAAAAGATATCR
jgi:uncharacterized protein YjbI with pentapeptide repeats